MGKNSGFDDNLISKMDFKDIGMLAHYIEGKFINKDNRNDLYEKLNKDSNFVRSYTDSFEYIKNLEYTEFVEIPIELKKKAKNKKKSKKLILKVVKNIVNVISNEFEKIKPKELIIEYLSSNDNKVKSQKFALGNSIIEIKGNEIGKAKIIIESKKGNRVLFKNINDDLSIIDGEMLTDVMTLNNIEKGVYDLKIYKEDRITIEII